MILLRRIKRYMKIKHKKVAASGIAVALAGVLGVGALLQTSVSVQASSAMMPGIEEIVSEASADKPFKILEIVDNTQDAEIGYYVSGQEPYIKLYSYTYKYKDENNTEQEETIHFQTLEEGLEKLPSDTLRKEFAQNVKIDDGNISGEGTGIKNIQSICYQDSSTGDAGDYPLSYSRYVEQYFISSDEEKSGNWTRIDFKDAKTDKSRTDTVKINGEYRENSAGTGDYTKQEQTYYPIREDSDDKSKTDKYRENIQNFYYADGGEANTPYFLEFEEVDNATVNAAFDANHNKTNGNSILSEYNYENGEYGYYENVYSDLTQEIVENIYTFPGENPEIDLSSAVQIPNITSTTSVNARTFSDGTGDFSSINEQNPTDTESNNADQTNISADNSQTADAFSSGDFSDGVSADGDIGNNDTIQTQNVSDTGTDSDFDAGTNQNAATEPAQTDAAQATAIIENDKIEPIIAYTQKTDGNVTAIDDSVGKSENPKVYYGRTIDQYPYYQYTLISDMKKVVACAAANQEAVDNGTFTPAAETDPEKRITFQDNQYWYWTVEANGTVERNPISVVTQRQPVSYDDIREIPQGLGYNYYYKVKQAYFCCKKGTETDNDHTYEYYGWYSPSYPDQNNVYIKVSDGDGKVATHYISEAEYKLTPGIGNYDFVPDETKDQKSVEVNHMYYQGGYKNNDWFKRHVFHLSPEDGDETVRKQFENFNIEVDTITVEEFNKEFGNALSATSTDNANVAATVNGDSTEVENADIDEIINEDSTEINDTPEDQTMDSSQNENQSADNEESDEQFADEGETSEVESIVSEAGVELVSIENEINEFSDNAENSTIDTTNMDGIAENNTADFQDEAEDTKEQFTDDADVFSAGDSATVSDSKLKDYDLVYINSALPEKDANVIATYNNSVKKSEILPCIINSAKVTKESGLAKAFNGFYNENDADQHYVTQFVYFFRNTFDGQDFSSLVSTAFATNFNTSSDDGITDDTQIGGFEEILEYIESENKYRQLGISSGSDFSSGDQQTPTPTPTKKLLSTELSHARAIEYIINYKWKRNVSSKSEINVLDIEPAKRSAKSSGQVIKNKIRKWLGIPVPTVSVCCEENNKEKSPGKNIMDGNETTIWHSNYSKEGEGVAGKDHGKNHVITIKYDIPATIEKIEYLPRSNKGHGTFTKFNLTYVSSEEHILSNCLWNGTNGKYQTYELLESIPNVREIRIEILNGKEGYASCAELKVDIAEDPVINIKNMTASEFVGHIDDINSKYDMIYIGDDATNRNKFINGTGKMLYTHVGGGTWVTDDWGQLNRLMGQLDKDYLDGIPTEKNIRLATADTYSEDGAGYFRGSGNDITTQIYQSLMEFVKSGYPVIFQSSLINTSGENRSVNTELVDSSSYYWQFMTDALKYENVFTTSELEEENMVDFYTNLAKPVIHLTEQPPEPPRVEESGNEVAGEYINGELRYTFTLNNDSDVSRLTTYNCKLYIDLNFDGNFSEKEAQDQYITITDSKGNVLSRKDDDRYELKPDEQYTLVRKIPMDYYKLITWKLEISNNTNSYIHSSVNGYAKQQNSADPISINVLQILPDQNRKLADGTICKGYWDLKTDPEFNEQLVLLKQKGLDDFEIKITTITVTEYEKWGDKAADNLKDFQIIIIGFNDVFQNIKNDKNQVGAIVDFISSGKSVIFSHDTTSFITYNYKNLASPKEVKNNETGQTLSISGNPSGDWGLSLNNILRSIVGMDRYGITSSTVIGNTTVSKLLKKGNVLTDNSEVSFKELMEVAGDIAYQTNDKSKSYAQTQAYTNSLINGDKIGWPGNASKYATATHATKVNDGAITQYPFKMGDEIEVSLTHGQYFQLALEQDRDINGESDGTSDIVVWYCLSGHYPYDDSPNDVRNNYFYYSKGNVIYTGTGHREVNKTDEIRLFINSIFAAANVTAVKPEVSFIKTLNPASEKEAVRYYMTDQTVWSSGNTLEKEMDFCINVRDYNMVSASLSETDTKRNQMTADFYIEDENGNVLSEAELPEELKNKRISSINGAISSMINYGNTEIAMDATDHTFHVENTAYKFKIPRENIEEHLMETSADGKQTYKSSCKLYVKITSTVYLYGQPKTSTSWASIDLKQRQLFDLD